METEIKMQICAEVQGARRTLMQFGGGTVCVAAFLGGVPVLRTTEMETKHRDCRGVGVPLETRKTEMEAAKPRWKAHVRHSALFFLPLAQVAIAYVTIGRG